MLPLKIFQSCQTLCTVLTTAGICSWTEPWQNPNRCQISPHTDGGDGPNTSMKRHKMMEKGQWEVHGVKQKKKQNIGHIPTRRSGQTKTTLNPQSVCQEPRSGRDLHTLWWRKHHRPFDKGVWLLGRSFSGVPHTLPRAPSRSHKEACDCTRWRQHTEVSIKLIESGLREENWK